MEHVVSKGRGLLRVRESGVDRLDPGQILVLLAHPLRDQARAAVASGGVVGIVVREDANSPVARPRDELDRGAARAPVVRSARLGVRRDGHDGGSLGDFDGLLDGVEKRGLSGLRHAREVPHRVRSRGALVLDENSLVGGELLDERHDLLGIAPPAGNVLEAGAHAVGAGLHAFDHEPAHRLDFVRLREPLHPGDLRVGEGLVLVLRHDHRPHGVVPHEEHGVRSEFLRLELLLLGRNRVGRAAVLIHDQSGDALGHQVRRGAALRIVRTEPVFVEPVRVRVEIDESRGDHQAGDVDGAMSLSSREIPDGHDTPALGRRRPPGTTGCPCRR